jgi:cytidine deaminase
MLAEAPATSADEELVAAATSAIRARFVAGRHQIAAAIRDSVGGTYVGLHLEATVGRASVCAEAVALGAAVLAGATDLETIVAVRHPLPAESAQDIRLVPPCGLCRELLLDYAPHAGVLLTRDRRLVRVGLAELLPEKYVGSKWTAVLGADGVGC